MGDEGLRGEEMDNENQIKVTTDYDKFDMMGSNREVNRGHVEKLKEAFETSGNLTIVQPILVNENMYIVDGQHRFAAAKELGLPIYYTVRPGLSVRDARNMNILHRGWTVDDFAHSYANANNPNYRKYLELREDYGFNHSTILSYCNETSDKSGIYAEFRKGDFVLANEPLARKRLEALTEIGEHINVSTDKPFIQAFLKVLPVPGFSIARLIRKLNSQGAPVMRRYGSIEEYLHAMEDIYNWQMTENSRLRLY